MGMTQIDNNITKGYRLVRSCLLHGEEMEREINGAVI